MNEGLSGWQKCKLGELTEIVTKGTTPSTLGEGFTEYGVNFIKSEAVGYDGRIDRSTFVFISPEMHEKLKRSQLKENDILFSMAGVFLGKNAMVLDDMLPANTNQALAIIRINQKKALPKFIHYFFRNPCTIEFVNNISGQSAQPNINFQEIKSIEINLPEIPEQKAIAAVLSSLDDKIDLLHRQNKTLESMAETLFRQWFIEEAQEEWADTTLDCHSEVLRGLSYKGSGLSDSGLGIPMHNLNSIYEGGGYKEVGIKGHSHYKNTVLGLMLISHQRRLGERISLFSRFFFSLP